MSSTLDLNGGTYTIGTDETETYFQVTDTSTGHDGTLIMSAGSSLVFDDTTNAGFSSVANALTIIINGNAGSPCSVRSAVAGPANPFTLPQTSTTMTATRVRFRDYTGVRNSITWILNNVDWGDSYATADDVLSLLRVYDPLIASRWADSTTSDPTTNELEDWCSQATGYIEQLTGHAWREALVVDQYYDVKIIWTELYEREFPVSLRHRSVRQFSPSSDKLEVWDGSTWVNFLTTYEEDRAKDFWVDYSDGIIYFKHRRPHWPVKGVRVTYRYGDVGVPEDIREACAKLAAIKFLESDWYKDVIPEGGTLIGKSGLPDKWRADVDRIIRNRRETKLIGFM